MKVTTASVSATTLPMISRPSRRISTSGSSATAITLDSVRVGSGIAVPAAPAKLVAKPVKAKADATAKVAAC
ncbi:MAG: hypothetical protein KGS45_02760 [Planctomycetes bacterium]|nr:hypothetical protein [Planctomycetota bacterium]